MKRLFTIVGVTKEGDGYTPYISVIENVNKTDEVVTVCNTVVSKGIVNGHILEGNKLWGTISEDSQISKIANTQETKKTEGGTFRVLGVCLGVDNYAIDLGCNSLEEVTELLYLEGVSHGFVLEGNKVIGLISDDGFFKN